MEAHQSNDPWSRDILQLIINQIDDGLSYFRLMQVNKLTYKMCKQLLIHKKGNNGKRSQRRSWTEIPGAPGVVNGLMIRVDASGHLMYKHGYINGKLHGVHITYFSQLFQTKVRYENGRYAGNLGTIKDVSPNDTIKSEWIILIALSILSMFMIMKKIPPVVEKYGQGAKIVVYVLLVIIITQLTGFHVQVEILNSR